jgi:hypothetical protein
MATTSKMKVEELRSELNQRGLITTGTKPTLVINLHSLLYSSFCLFSYLHFLSFTFRFVGFKQRFAKKISHRLSMPMPMPMLMLLPLLERDLETLLRIIPTKSLPLVLAVEFPINNRSKPFLRICTSLIKV